MPDFQDLKEAQLKEKHSVDIDLDDFSKEKHAVMTIKAICFSASSEKEAESVLRRMLMAIDVDEDETEQIVTLLMEEYIEINSKK